MNLHKALQVKNKSVGDITKKFEKIQKHNVFIQREGYIPSFDTKKLLAEVISDTRNLADLKSKIAVANVKIQSNIHLIAELKSLITKLNSININEGESQQYGRNDTIIVNKQVAQIKETEISDLVKQLEEEIVKLQDEIDHHNATVTL
jgi:hypothetical protein